MMAVAPAECFLEASAGCEPCKVVSSGVSLAPCGHWAVSGDILGLTSREVGAGMWWKGERVLLTCGAQDGPECQRC